MSSFVNLRTVVLFLAIFYFGILPPAFAQQVHWKTSDGPYGGVVYSIARSEKGTLVAGHATSTVRSTDNGSHWTTLMSSNGPHVIYRNSVFYLLDNEHGMMRSTDDGIDWESFNPPGITNAGGYLVTNDSGDLLLTANSCLYMSANGGQWQKLDTLPLFPGDLQLGNDRTIYMIRGRCGLPGLSLVSKDLGHRWDTAIVYQGKYLNRLHVTHSGVLLVSSDSGVYRSLDRGGHWINNSNGLHAQTSGQPDSYNGIFENSVGSLFCASSDGLYQSVDSGSTWSNVTGTGWAQPGWFSMTNDIVFNGTTPVYAATYAGFLRSEGGSKWVVSDSGLFDGVFATIYSPSGALLAGSYSGIYESLDGSRTWVQRAYGKVANQFALGRGQTVYAACGDSGIVVSHDAGQTWEMLASPIGWVFQIAYDTKFGIMLAAGSNNGLWISTDDGKSWNNPIRYQQIKSMYVTPAGRLYAGVGGAAYESNDHGITWISYACGLGNQDVVGLAEVRDTFVLAMNDDPNGNQLEIRIFPTHDQNSRRTPDIDFPDNYVWHMAERSNGDLYIQSPSGIYKSFNAGRYWLPVDKEIFPVSNWNMQILNSGQFVLSTYRGILTSQESLATPQTPLSVYEHAAASEISLEVYPNPSFLHRRVRVHLPDAATVSLTIEDAIGRTCATVFRGKLGAEEREFSVDDNMLHGEYRLVLHGASGRSASVPFIVE